MDVCYRHPSEETGVHCSSCGRPICPDCMTTTPVGMRCPECSRQRTKVNTMQSMAGGEPRVTVAVMIACGVLALATGTIGFGGPRGGALYGELALRGVPEISTLHEYWRLVTSGFLHAGLMHIFFNMYMLWWIGAELERRIGSPRFGAIYLTALLWGSMGALAQTTTVGVVGASGAVFGVLGALMVELRRSGYDPLSGGLGGLLILNLIIGFIPGLHIAWGGHIGGFIGGGLAAAAFGLAARRKLPAVGFAACVVLCAIAVAGAIAISGAGHNIAF